jgi:hypothetical protein
MMPLLSLIENPEAVAREFKSNFGVSKADFEKVQSFFSPIWQRKREAAIAARWVGKERKTKPGSGLSKSKLKGAKPCLAFLLYYLKQYPTFDALGTQFNLTGGHANHLFHLHWPTLVKALKEMKVPAGYLLRRRGTVSEFCRSQRLKSDHFRCHRKSH